MSTEFEQNGELRPGLFPEETAEEAVARIVAQNPQKHGVPLAEREHRLVEQARRIAAETQAFFDAPDDAEHTAELQKVIDDANATIKQAAGIPNGVKVEADNVEYYEAGDVHRPIEEELGSDKAGMEKVHAGQAMVEGGHQEDAAGSAAAGAEQDSAAGQPAGNEEVSHVEPGRNEAGDGVATADQRVRLAADAGADAVGSVAHAANFMADKIDEVTAQALRGEFDANTKAITLDDIDRIKTEGPEAVLGPPDVVLPGTCAHFWPEDPDEETRCPLCQMTFRQWVES